MYVFMLRLSQKASQSLKENMNRSNVHLFDLPDEILLIILNKLNNIDVLYSLLDINNGRLNVLAQENTFINILKFVSIDDTSLINRFCIDILPRIHRNVKCFIFDPIFMERILLTTDYPNLIELEIHNFHEEIALNYFTNKSSLRSIFQEQITNLILINNDECARACSLDYTAEIYAHILTFFKNLKILRIIEPSVVSYPPLSLCYFPSTTFSSSILTHLYINVQTFDDCLCLLDGRLKQLTTLFVTVCCAFNYSRTIHNMNKLPNLKCFSLQIFYEFQPYDRIASLLRRMSNLEKLTLNISIKDRNSVIDGTYIQHDILDCMPQLHSFTFYICTYVETVDLSYKLSSEDIQQTLMNIGLQDVTSIVNYDCDSRVACSIFSLPFQFRYLKDLGNKFPNIVFSYVTYLHVKDNDPFRHEFFVRIAKSFPLLKYLRIYNVRSSLPVDLMTFTSDNCQLYSTIEYSHLTTLDLSCAHREYVEQFLNETKIYMPCLMDLLVKLDDLIVVTKNFTRNETRRNCTKVKTLFIVPPRLEVEGLRDYFPSLYK
ncbi:unnamed protein product [Rotaria socialis]|uniref:F-box domain-containing protein n=4 Tax=Rotaria TaxID=231623 RepID=A0A818HAC1_9BILA|nr:unnamed protein product [Rotaria socialis]CAF4840592.1 unnamed protein product [Rotaria socialis]